MSAPPEVEKENHERWVISYADLVTLLLGFFIIMYSSSQLDVEKFELFAFGLATAFNTDVNEGAIEGSPLFEGGTGIVPESRSVAAIQSELELIRTAIAERAALAGVAVDGVSVSRAPQQIVIRLADSLLFPSASAQIRPQALSLLDVIGSVVAELPNQLRVEGHTDNVPVGTERYPTNWELSSARATAVLRHLVEEVGVKPSRLFAAGYGEYRPVAANRTPEGRALNRRADIVVLYGPGEAPPAPPAAPEPVVPIAPPLPGSGGE